MTPEERAEALRQARWYGERARNARRHGNTRYAKFCARKARNLIDAANGRERTVERPEPRTHCQICERGIKARTGRIAHHGYERPGTGYQTPSCPGARKLPYEDSRDAIPPYVARLESWRDARRDLLAQVESGTVPVPNPRWRNPYKPDPNYKALIEPGDASYARARHAYQYKVTHEIADTTAEIERLKKRYEGWPGTHKA